MSKALFHCQQLNEISFACSTVTPSRELGGGQLLGIVLTIFVPEHTGIMYA